MIRAAAFLILAAAIALGAAWIADRPGEVVLTWQHWQISTSITFAAIFFILAVLAAMLIWTIIRFITRSPDLVALFFRERRRTKGWRAITQGLIAIGTGNQSTANRAALEAKKFAGENPLTLLLAAQAAQLEGNVEKAEAEFGAMLKNAETKLLGLRGLYIEAMRRHDLIAAHAHAKEAVQSEKMPSWAAEALLEFQTRARDWTGALATLESAVQARVIDKVLGRRRRAVLLTAQAHSVQETDPTLARELSHEATKLAPDLVPAASLAGRLFGVNGNLRKAGNVIEKAWASLPHPDLAEAYAHLRPGDSAEDRYKRVKKLAKKKPDDLESKLALARAAIEAHHFVEARAILEPLLGDPTQRTCLLMAELEATEHGDHGKAREWTIRALRARRDPAWIADGYISREWLPMSPRTGVIDAFKWGAPEESATGPLLDQAAESALSMTLPTSVMRDVPEPKPVVAAPVKRATPIAAIVAEPPRPDDPGPEIEEETPQQRGFSIFGWRPGPST